jgi:hypothetical protein
MGLPINVFCFLLIVSFCTLFCSVNSLHDNSLKWFFENVLDANRDGSLSLDEIE